MPALPQQVSPSGMSVSSTPGIAASSARGWAPDALLVREVTGVVMGDAHVERPVRRHRAERGQKFVDVLHLLAEPRPRLLESLRKDNLEAPWFGEELVALPAG
jgi:hypothetical protein